MAQDFKAQAGGSFGDRRLCPGLRLELVEVSVLRYDADTRGENK